MEATSSLARHIFSVGIPFLPFSNAFSIHNSCGIKHYEQEQTDMQPLLFPTAPNYSALSYKVKTSIPSDGCNFYLGPMPDKVFPLLKLNPIFSIPCIQSHPYPIFHTNVHAHSHTEPATPTMQNQIHLPCCLS